MRNNSVVRAEKLLKTISMQAGKPEGGKPDGRRSMHYVTGLPRISLPQKSEVERIQAGRGVLEHRIFRSSTCP